MTKGTHNPETAGDTVIREVRAAKERLGRLYDFDVRRIAAAARANQQRSGHEVVSRSKKATR
jgi:hypothetical protein